MQVTQERFEDAGEHDANGFYEYYYSGTIYRFTFPTRTFVARRYDDETSKVSFLCIENPRGRKGKTFIEIPRHDPEFREAVAFLRTLEGIESIYLLLDEYVQIDLAEFAS
jgi:hypothetical protein